MSVGPDHIALLNRRVAKAEADARHWEAKWLQEKMNAKAEIERLKRGYVPQDIAQECLAALAPLDVEGEPNTLWALVQKAMRLLSEKDAEIAALRQRVEELRETLMRTRIWHASTWMPETVPGDLWARIVKGSQ